MQENGLFIYRIKQKQNKKTTPWKKKQDQGKGLAGQGKGKIRRQTGTKLQTQGDYKGIIKRANEEGNKERQVGQINQ